MGLISMKRYGNKTKFKEEWRENLYRSLMDRDFGEIASERCAEKSPKTQIGLKLELKDYDGSLICTTHLLKTKWGGVGVVVGSRDNPMIAFEYGDYIQNLTQNCINEKELRVVG